MSCGIYPLTAQSIATHQKCSIDSFSCSISMNVYRGIHIPNNFDKSSTQHRTPFFNMNILRSRRLVALLLGALNLAKRGFAQECNAEDQFWDQVRAQCRLWAVTHRFYSSNTGPSNPLLGRHATVLELARSSRYALKKKTLNLSLMRFRRFPSTIASRMGLRPLSRCSRFQPLFR